MAPPQPRSRAAEASGEATEAWCRAAEAWREADPDPETRAQIDALVAEADPEVLEEHFGRRLGFGTAGIRGPLGPGPNRMNLLQVQQVAVAVARHLLATEPDAARRGVVVGRDARHGSARFAAEVVRVLSIHGLPVHVLDEPVPTPLAVFAVSELGAAAGVVVTASHNPPTDNGVKVVWSDGAQIVPPVDEGIAAAMAPMPADSDANPVPADEVPGEVHHLGGAGGDHPVVLGYLARAASLIPLRPAHPLRIATTALHGVGAGLLERVLRAAGHEDLHPVAAQLAPDPDFPTVALPNPEEPHALDALVALAEERRADVGVALDPDADRLAVVVPGRHGGWSRLSGDEVGALLLWHLLARTATTPDRLVATTVVSSQLAGKMCGEAGVHFRETPTGFKWLCRPGLEHPEWHQVLLYEEALGYAVGPTARDKDGITAALVVLDLVSELRAASRTPWDVLDDLARRFGAHVTLTGSVPRRGGELAPERHELRPDGIRVIVRPSGTEPKVKYYLEAVAAVPPRQDPESVRTDLRTRLEQVVRELRRELET